MHHRLLGVTVALVLTLGVAVIVAVSPRKCLRRLRSTTIPLRLVPLSDYLMIRPIPAAGSRCLTGRMGRHDLHYSQPPSLHHHHLRSTSTITTPIQPQQHSWSVQRCPCPRRRMWISAPSAWPRRRGPGSLAVGIVSPLDLYPRERALWKNRDLDKARRRKTSSPASQYLGLRSLRSGADGGNAVSRLSLLLPAPRAHTRCRCRCRSRSRLRPHAPTSESRLLCTTKPGRAGSSVPRRLLRPRCAPEGATLSIPFPFSRRNGSALTTMQCR